jgi:predicted nucleic acid-binding protein
MIVVDSSVWISAFRGVNSISRQKLDEIARLKAVEILGGDLILVEVLRGARDERHADMIEKWLCAYLVSPMLDVHLALAAAKNYRWLPTHGVTIRKTIDLLIATFCIELNHELLHEDRDFDLAAKHLPLRIV